MVRRNATIRNVARGVLRGTASLLRRAPARAARTLEYASGSLFIVVGAAIGRLEELAWDLEERARQDGDVRPDRDDD